MHDGQASEGAGLQWQPLKNNLLDPQSMTHIMVCRKVNVLDAKPCARMMRHIWFLMMVEPRSPCCLRSQTVQLPDCVVFDEHTHTLQRTCYLL